MEAAAPEEGTVSFSRVLTRDSPATPFFSRFLPFCFPSPCLSRGGSRCAVVRISTSRGDEFLRSALKLVTPNGLRTSVILQDVSDGWRSYARTWICFSFFSQERDIFSYKSVIDYFMKKQYTISLSRFARRATTLKNRYTCIRGLKVLSVKF